MSALTFPPKRTDRVRLVGFMAKLETVSDADFYKYWHEVHGPLFANLEIVKKNLLLFEQHHYTNQFEAGAKALGFDVPAYHGLTIFEAESYEKIMEVFTSEEYARICQPEEKNYLDRAKTGFFPGSIVTFIDKKN
ncbi:hypothetical protein K466DRAFT_494925 [Polyporus arcularius HHB13444]|uniref:EthD domain-containing protein n=1 Tax=Polyporus arcularius HHB13444 TaxID=1314778 RepID=A0A5C3P6S5_9APHY|nr:hypothetical protein K466DRAFT_494925 [Polyporus arcularius HHB13444]